MTGTNFSNCCHNNTTFSFSFYWSKVAKVAKVEGLGIPGLETTTENCSASGLTNLTS